MSAERAIGAPAAAAPSDGRRRLVGAGLLALAALTMLLAAYVAGREAPRQSGDLVQLWIVPGAAEVGVRNGLATGLQCALDMGGAGAPRELALAPGETETVELGAATSEVEVMATCTDGTTAFTRRVALRGAAAQ